MIISDLNYLETVSTSSSVEGGTNPYSFYENDYVAVSFNSNNNFATYVNSPYTLSNSASAGAKGSAENYTNIPVYSFTKADTLASTSLFGGSISASTSAAVINPAVSVAWH